MPDFPARQGRENHVHPPPPLKARVDPVTGEVLETEELRMEGLAQLRRAIAAAGFREVRKDDQFLLAFLRARKYEVPRALEVLKNFSNFWYSNPTLINGLCAEKIRRVYDLDFLRALSTSKDVHGNAVSLMFVGNLDYSQVTDFEMLQMSLYNSLYCFESDLYSRRGLTIVESFEGFSMWRMAMVQKKLAEPGQQSALTFGLDTIPMRIRSLYVVKQPWYFTAFWHAIKWVFRKKLRDRVVLLGNNFSRLHAAVPPEALPAEFQGTLQEAKSAWLDDRARDEAEKGMIGGFALPLDVEDPTGERRRASMAASGGAAGSVVAAAPEAGSKTI